MPTKKSKKEKPTKTELVTKISSTTKTKIAAGVLIFFGFGVILYGSGFMPGFGSIKNKKIQFTSCKNVDCMCESILAELTPPKTTLKNSYKQILCNSIKSDPVNSDLFFNNVKSRGKIYAKKFLINNSKKISKYKTKRRGKKRYRSYLQQSMDMQKYLTKLDQPNFLLQENDKIVSTIFKNAGGNVVNLKNENLKIFFIKISPNRGVIYLKPLKFNKKYIGNATYKMAQYKSIFSYIVNKSKGDGTYEELTNPSIFDNPDAQGTSAMIQVGIDSDGTPLVNLGVNYLDVNAFVNLIDGDFGVRYGNDFSGGIEKTTDGWKVKFGGKSITSTIGTDGSIEHDIHGLKIKGVKGSFGVSLSGINLFRLDQKEDGVPNVKIPFVDKANSLADRLKEAFTKPSVSKQNDNNGFGGTGFSQPPSDSNNNETGNTPTETGYTPPTQPTPPTTDNDSDTNQDTTKTSWEETEGTTFGGKDLDNYWETSYEREVDENGNNTDRWKSTKTDQDGNKTTEEFTDQDSDGDGVPDKDDSYPNDPERQTYMEDPIGETGGSRGGGRLSDAAQILYIMNEIEADGSKDPQKDILFDPTPDHDSGDGTHSDAAMTLFDFDDPSIDWGPNGKPAKNGDSGFEIQDFAIDWGPNGKPKNKEHDPFGIGITFPIDPKSPIMFSRLEMISNAISFINCNNTACSSLSVGSNMLNNSQLNSVFNKRFINNVVSVFK